MPGLAGFALGAVRVAAAPRLLGPGDDLPEGQSGSTGGAGRVVVLDLDPPGPHLYPHRNAADVDLAADPGRRPPLQRVTSQAQRAGLRHHHRGHLVGKGGVDRAGSIAYGWLKSGGDARRLIAALGHALLSEDAGFHWFQIVEAAVRQYAAWPEGSEEGALILAGAARFLAAHTPTRRELPHVVRTAARLRRGDDLFEES